MTPVHDVDSLARDLARMTPSAARAGATRDALLHAAAQRAEAPARRGRRVAFAFAGACAVAVAIAVWMTGGPTPSPSPTVAYRGSILPSEGARYERVGEPGHETVVLDSGVMRFEVDKLAPDETFEVVVGADRVRVRGTIFHVVATAGALESVAVVEGVVDVYVAGEPARTLTAGQSWRAGSASTPVVDAEGDSVAPTVVPEPVAPAPAPRRRRRKRPEPAAVAPPASPDAGPPTVVEVPGESEFRTGWAAFESGDYGRAVVLLRRGCGLEAGSGFVEDSCFWLAVSLARAGRERQAETAFAGYLERFSGGSRADEARVSLGALLLSRGERAAAAPLFRAAMRSPVPGIRDRATRGLRAATAD